jgi:hypothetical protein
MEHDLDYFSRRLTEERMAALRASDFRVRDHHLELARLYQALLTSSRSATPSVSGLKGHPEQ